MVVEEMTVVDAKARRDAAQAEVNRLFNRQSDLTAQIQECADQARLGKAVGDLNVLASEKAATDRELDDAELNLELAQGRLTTVTASEHRQRFDAIAAESKQRREEFTQTLRTACLQLGAIMRLRGEGGEVAKSLRVSVAGTIQTPITYEDPFLRDALAELNAPLPQASDFTVGWDGLSPDYHLGWKTEIKICPLNPKGESR